MCALGGDVIASSVWVHSARASTGERVATLSVSRTDSGGTCKVGDKCVAIGAKNKFRGDQAACKLSHAEGRYLREDTRFTIMV